MCCIIGKYFHVDDGGEVGLIVLLHGAVLMMICCCWRERLVELFLKLCLESDSSGVADQAVELERTLDGAKKDS